MNAGAEINLRLGQRVSHGEFQGKRVTGVIRGLDTDGREVMADIALDSALVFPARDGLPECVIRHQRVPAIELTPADERDDLIAELSALVRISIGNVRSLGPAGALGDLPHAPYREWLAQLEAVYAKATGSVA